MSETGGLGPKPRSDGKPTDGRGGPFCPRKPIFLGDVTNNVAGSRLDKKLPDEPRRVSEPCHGHKAATPTTWSYGVQRGQFARATQAGRRKNGKERVLGDEGGVIDGSVPCKARWEVRYGAAHPAAKRQK